MVRLMVGAMGRFAVLVAAASAVGAPSESAPAPVTTFGGAGSVRIAHVGHIEVDLEPSSPAGLRRIACPRSSLPGQACYVAR